MEVVNEFIQVCFMSRITVKFDKLIDSNDNSDFLVFLSVRGLTLIISF